MASKLGYLLSGPLPAAQHQLCSETTNAAFHIGITTGASCNLEKFWNLEAAGIESQ